MGQVKRILFIFFILFFVYEKNQAQISQEYFIEINDFELVVNEKEKSYQWNISVQSNLPEKSVLKGYLKYLSKAGERVITETSLRMSKDISEIKISFGPFSQRQKLIPGNYEVCLFYSLAIQVEKQNKDIPFIEGQKERIFGTTDDYQKIFDEEKANITKIIDGVNELYLLGEKNLKECQLEGGFKRWQTLTKDWEKKLEILRKKDNQQSRELLYPLFYSAAQNIFPLLNVLEDMLDGHEKIFQKNSYELYHNQKKTFLSWHEKTKEDFYFELIALAPDSKKVFLEQIQEMILSLEKNYSEKIPLQEKLTAEQKRDVAIAIATFWNLQKEIPVSFASVEKIKKANDWLSAMRQTFSTAILSMPSESAADIAPLFQTILALCIHENSTPQREEEKEKKMKHIENMKTSLIEKYLLQNILRESLLLDFHDIQKHTNELSQIISSPEIEFWSNHYLKWTGNWMQRQDKNAKLLSFNAEKKTLQLYQHYAIITMRLISFYEQINFRMSEAEKINISDKKELQEIQKKVENILQQYR